MNLRKGRVIAVSVSDRKGVPKQNTSELHLIPGWGVEGDAHSGTWHRQVSLLAVESIQKMREKGLEVGPGDFAENITTEGLDLWSLPVGSRVRIGDQVVLEVSQIGKECHTGCAIFVKVGKCIMPKEGIFAKVVEGGVIRPGDPILILERPSP